MSVKKIVYMVFLPLLPLLLLLLNSGFLLEDETLLNKPFYKDGIVSEDSLDSGQNQKRVQAIEQTLLTGKASVSLTAEESTDYLLLSGEVRPRDEVDIFPDTQGKIREMRIKTGDEVSSDQILALVDPSRPGMNYTLSPVKSSIIGTVTAVYTNPGAFITPGQPLCKISTLSQLEIEVYVPEGSIHDVSLGMIGTVSSPVLPELNETLILNHISPVLDSMTRSMKVVFVPVKKKSSLKSGMYIDIKIPLE